MKTLRIEPLTAAAYAPFGTVVEAHSSGGAPANQGTARRFDRLGPLEALRPTLRGTSASSAARRAISLRST